MPKTFTSKNKNKNKWLKPLRTNGKQSYVIRHSQQKHIRRPLGALKKHEKELLVNEAINVLQKQQQQEQTQQQEQELALKQFRRFIPLSDRVRNGIVYIHPQEQTTLSGPVFVLNICHGIIPLKIRNNENPRVQVIEYSSPVHQRRIVKAPMGTCPTSNRILHNDIITRILSIQPTDEDAYHNAISLLIREPDLLENQDICKKNLHFEVEFTGERPIYGEGANCYKDIETQPGNETVNKMFNTLTNDSDDGLYILHHSTFRLQCAPPPHITPLMPLTPACTCIIMAEGFYVFEKHRVEENEQLEIRIPANTFMNLTYEYDFAIETTLGVKIWPGKYPSNKHVVSAVEIILFVEFNKEVHLPEKSTFINYGDNILYKNVYRNNNLITPKNIILENDVYKIYPYPIGLFNSGMITYEPTTDLLSCPYFIHYVNNIHDANRTETDVNEIIRPAKSLLYNYYHRLVTATCSSIIAHYFSNCSTYYSYDFACQAYEAIDNNGEFENDELFYASPGNLMVLQGYARGMRKTKKRDKMNKTRQIKNKLKLKSKHK